MILNYPFEQGKDVDVAICVTVIYNSVQYTKYEDCLCCIKQVVKISTTS